MCFFLIFENLFDYLLRFTKITDIWYSFDYYLVLTCFTSRLFTYFKIKHQYLTFMSHFSFITDIDEYIEILNPLPPFIKFNKDLQPLRFI